MKRAEEVLTESKIRCLTAADGWRRKQEVCLSAQLHPRSLKPLYFLSRSSCDKELLSLEPPGSGFCSRRWAEQRGERLCEKQNYLRRSILELQPVQVESTFKVSLQPPPHSVLLTYDPGGSAGCVVFCPRPWRSLGPSLGPAPVKPSSMCAWRGSASWSCGCRKPRGA